MPDILSDYLKSVGARWSGSGWLTRCPAHDDRSPSLSVSVGRDGRILLKCHAGCSIHNVLDALGLTIKDLFPRGNNNNGNTRLLEQGQALRLAASSPSCNKRKPDGYLDKVYRYLISLLGLCDEHREHLLSRGISESLIEDRCYRTLPLRREAIVSRLSREFDLSGVPGFGFKDGRWVMSGSPGILLPVVSRQKIVGFQIRLDRDRDGLKYKHLSSSWLERGASSGARVHMSVPNMICRPEVWITEGVLKADISAQMLGAIVWSVPGVSNWREVLENWQLLPWHVVIAYDNDAKRSTKRSVRSHAYRLADALWDKSIHSCFAIWRHEKGLDDALLSGEKIRLWSSD